jgi:hypothetical protein
MMMHGLANPNSPEGSSNRVAVVTEEAPFMTQQDTASRSPLCDPRKVTFAGSFVYTY